MHTMLSESREYVAAKLALLEAFGLVECTECGHSHPVDEHDVKPVTVSV